MQFFQRNFPIYIISLLLLLFLITAGCRTIYVSKISDKRIPETTLEELKRIILEKSTKDSLYSFASFNHEVVTGRATVFISRLITFKSDSSAKLEYTFSNYIRGYSDQTQSLNGALKKEDHKTVIMTKIPVYYCTPHNGEQHKTEKFEDIPKTRNQFGCGKDWIIDWVDR